MSTRAAVAITLLIAAIIAAEHFDFGVIPYTTQATLWFPLSIVAVIMCILMLLRMVLGPRFRPMKKVWGFAIIGNAVACMSWLFALILRTHYPQTWFETTLMIGWVGFVVGGCFTFVGLLYWLRRVMW